MTGKMITATAIEMLKQKYNILEVHNTSVRYCDFDYSKQVQDVAEVAITATYAIQNSQLTHTFYITIKDGDVVKP